MEQHSSHFRQLSRPPQRGTGESQLERERYRAYLVLSFVFVGVQIVLLGYSLIWGGQVLSNFFSFLAAAFFSYLTFTRKVSLDKSTVMAGYLSTAWIIGILLAVIFGFIPFRPALMLTTALSSLIALSWLHIRQGVIATVILTGLLLLAVLLRVPQDMEMLLWTLYLNGLLVFFNLYGRRINEERLRSEMLEHLAFHDPLTGTLNRRGGWMKLEELMADPAEIGGIMLVDIDSFKRINDRLGHAVGDDVLVAVARALEGEHRARLVARWGGEEFLMVLPGLTPPEMQGVAQDVLRVTQVLQLPGVTSVPVSIGVAMRSESGHPDQLLALADQRMYAAKQQGGNQWVAISW